jgi:hypothetical protein
MKYIKYFNYIIRHKWYVMIECFKVGLYWRGIVHDLSKFLPSEFIPYANYFYGNYYTVRDLSGYDINGLKRKKIEKDFNFAWLLHQKRNKHHWQWWILSEDEGGVKILEIKYPYNLEIICDWIGAGKARGHFSPKDDKYLETRNWYKSNGVKMQLYPKTKEWIESTIKL